MNSKENLMSRIAIAFGTAVLAVAVAAGLSMVKPAPVKAWATPPCDFLTGGGWIVYNGAKGTFGVGGGCKNGSPTWGHLEYVDHGIGLNVHGTSITGYFFIDEGTGTDSKTHQPTGTRGICGTARTNLYGDVNFAVRAEDLGEPGTNDQFDIRLTDPANNNAPLYDTTTQCFPHYLGSYVPCSPGSGGGGNIQLHKPNPSTSGSFGGSCPAYPAFAGQ